MHRDVGLHESRSANDVPARVAERVADIRRNHHGRGIQVVQRPAARRNRIADDVRAISRQSAHLERRTRAVIQIHRQSADRRVDHTELPAAQHPVNQHVRAAHVLPVLTDRQIPHDRRRVIQRLVVTGRAFFVPHIRKIHPGVIAARRFQMSGRIIDRLRPRKRIQHIQPARVAFFHFQLERVIRGETDALRHFDGVEVADRPARLERKILPHLIRRRLIPVAQHHQMHAVAAHISRVHHQRRRNFTLHVQMPALHIAVRIVLRDVARLRVQRIEIRRHREDRRIPQLRRPEARPVRVGRTGAQRKIRRALIENRAHDIRPVVGQQIFPAHAVEVDPGNPVTTAQHRLVHGAVSETETRRPVVLPRIHQRLAVKAAALRLDQRVGRRIEIRQPVVRYPLRRRELIPHAQIQGQPGVHLVIVLNVAEVHPLLQVDNHVIVQIVGIPRSHQEVRQPVRQTLRRGGTRHARVAEQAVISVLPVDRIEVVDRRRDVLVLVTGLQRVLAEIFRKIHLRIHHERILKLRIRSLPPELRVPRHALAVQRAHHIRIRRQAADSELRQQTRLPHPDRRFAAVEPGDSQPRFDQRRRIDRIGRPRRHLLIELVHRAVVVAARHARNVARHIEVRFPLAVPHERVQLLVRNIVDLPVALVVVDRRPRQRTEVVAETRDIRIRQRIHHRPRERTDHGRRKHAVRINRPGVRIFDRGPETRRLVSRRRNGRERQRSLHAAQPFVIHEEKQFVFNDAAAQRRPELILLVHRLHAAQRLEETHRVQFRVAHELPRAAMKTVRSAANRRVDHRARRAPVLRAVVIRRHAILRHRVRIQLHDLIRKALVAGAVGVVVHPVQHEIVERAPLPVDVVRSVPARDGAVFEHRLADARRQQRQIRIRPPVQREIQNLPRRHHLPAVARIGFEYRGGTGDRHALRDAAHLQGQIHPLVRVHGYRKPVRRSCLEARRFRLQTVIADADLEELIVALRVRGRRLLRSVRQVAENHLARNHHVAGLVFNRAEYRGGVELCEERRTAEKKNCGTKDASAAPAWVALKHKPSE